MTPLGQEIVLRAVGTALAGLSIAFAGYMLDQGGGRIRVNGMEHLAIFAQPRGAPPAARALALPSLTPAGHARGPDDDGFGRRPRPAGGPAAAGRDCCRSRRPGMAENRRRHSCGRSRRRRSPGRAYRLDCSARRWMGLARRQRGDALDSRKTGKRRFAVRPKADLRIDTDVYRPLVSSLRARS